LKDTKRGFYRVDHNITSNSKEAQNRAEVLKIKESATQPHSNNIQAIEYIYWYL